MQLNGSGMKQSESWFPLSENRFSVIWNVEKALGRRGMLTRDGKHGPTSERLILDFPSYLLCD